MQLTSDQAMLIYQRVIDKTAGGGEGATWWANVHAELEAVIAAPTTIATPTRSTAFNSRQDRW